MRYRPLKGKVLHAELLCGNPKFIKSGRRKKGAKGLGLRYEAKVQRHLLAMFDGYMPGPWFAYTTDEAPARINYAQPDGIIVDIARGQITICEMKYKHCADAYFQLLDKYLPIVRLFFNNLEEKSIWTFATVEIVYWYDGTIAFPTKPRMRKQLRDVCPNELAVHICRP